MITNKEYLYFSNNLNYATKVVNTNTTRPYLIELCKVVIGRYYNLLELYNILYDLSIYKPAKQIERLFALLCFQVINLIISIKTNNLSLYKQTILKIEVIQESISNIV